MFSSNMLQVWANEMSSREVLLNAGESSIPDEVPAVRNSSVPKVVNEKNKMVSDPVQEAPAML